MSVPGKNPKPSHTHSYSLQYPQGVATHMGRNGSSHMPPTLFPLGRWSSFLSRWGQIPPPVCPIPHTILLSGSISFSFSFNLARALRSLPTCERVFLWQPLLFLWGVPMIIMETPRGRKIYRLEFSRGVFIPLFRAREEEACHFHRPNSTTKPGKLFAI
jgi:hypothetical protein